MKKSVFIFAVVACLASSLAQGAVTIKKAAPVATKKADAIESTTSLLPTVIGLVSNVKNLSTQQQQLSADCVPTSDEIKTVNDLVKEWAKIGDTSAKSAVSGLGDPCRTSFEAYMKDADDGEFCYEVFKDSSDLGMIWESFPKASKADRCDDDTNKNCKPVYNIYEVLSKVTFSDEDYTQSEAKKIAALKEKAQRCGTDRLKAAKRELYGGFLTQTLSSVGQSSGAAGTSSVMEAVSAMGGSSDIKSIGTSLLPSLGSMATQVMDK